MSASQRKRWEPNSEPEVESEATEGTARLRGTYWEGFADGVKQGWRECEEAMSQGFSARHHMGPPARTLPPANGEPEQHPLASSPTRLEPEPEDPRSWPGTAAEKIKRYLRGRTPPNGAPVSELERVFDKHTSLKPYRMENRPHPEVVRLDSKFYLRDHLGPDDVRRWKEQKAKEQAQRKSKR